jgi:hypothetical protein
MEDISMKEVILNMTEQEKYKTIKELVDHNGNKKRAAIKLGLSIRQINRLINKYKKEVRYHLFMATVVGTQRIN